MKVLKENYKFILGILVGILICSIGVYAGALMNSNEVTFTPQNNKWNVTKVDEALNSLYSVAVPEEYTGTTEITPTYSDITLNTQDKLLKNNITISGIPSTYKNLTSTTTATAADIATGKTSYNNVGELITGNAVFGGDCVSGTYTLTSECTTTTGCTIFEGFNPSKFFIYYTGGTTKYIQYYDKSIDANNVKVFPSTSNMQSASLSTYWRIENNKFNIHNVQASTVSWVYNYVMCK